MFIDYIFKPGRQTIDFFQIVPPDGNPGLVYGVFFMTPCLRTPVTVQLVFLGTET